MFKIQNISVSVNEKTIINDCSLEIYPGECHALVGPNGSGKSSLSLALMGHPHYHITSGSYFFYQENMHPLPPEKRARAGIFLSFQSPVQMPGVKIITFLHAAYRHLTDHIIDLKDFKALLEQIFERVGLPSAYVERFLHDGFSGGERKRLELAQLLLFPMKLAILDELDSGIDADGLKRMADLLLQLRQDRPELMILMITHYTSMIDAIIPDKIHTMSMGKLYMASGDSYDR